MAELTLQQALDLATRAHGSGDFAQAETLYRQILALEPTDSAALHRLAILLMQTRRVLEGLDLARKVIVLSPQFPDARNTLGMGLQLLDNPAAAIDAYHAAIALNPDYAVAFDNLGNALKDVGRVTEAIASYRRALEITPMNPTPLHHICYSLYFDPAVTPEVILAENKKWNELHALPLMASSHPHSNDKHPTRRLRIGYVSPDFRDHALALVAMPLFANHDHAAFEIFFYADVAAPDAHTQRFQHCADTWRSTVGMNDQQVADLIRNDGIDLLIDLTMHMGHNRLAVFARSSAPVQLTWLAYPGTTGMSAIQYRLTDPWLDPPENNWMYTEETIPALESFWCYDPHSEPLDVGELPMLQSNRVTFGCLNACSKINDPTLAVWRRIFDAVPGSRLLLLCPAGEPRERVRDHLKNAPVDIEFLDRMPRRQYLETYRRIDLCLETFPYNGHTTSLDAMWMGVPTLTMAGTTAVARAGWSQLSNIGLPDLVAWTVDDYIHRVVSFLHDRPRAAALRAELRSRMQRSPLMVGPRFARRMEATFRSLWQRWCASA